MCNRVRGIHWSELPRHFYTGPRLNFAFNPNVAPTELVPIFVAELGGSPRAVIAGFGITMAGRDGRPRAPLANDKVSTWLDLDNQDPLAEPLLLDLEAFATRPMDRAMNSPRQKELAVIDPAFAAY